MGFMRAEVYKLSSNTLGEGPVWDHRSEELLWVDIDEQKLYILKKSKELEIHEFEEKIGFACPASNGNYIIGLANGIYEYNRQTRSAALLHHPETDKTNNRWNDGKCCPDGALWGGTMSQDEKLNQGALYQLSTHKKLTKVLGKVSISNGLAWHKDLNKMYYIDSPTQTIQVFDYKPGCEVITKSHEFATDKSLGYPDGMSIDEDGMLWVAQWDGYCIARYHPGTGQMITKIDVPAPRVTSCCFGGKDLSRLFITTARTRLSSEALEKYPLSGSVFVADTNTKGLVMTPFG